MNILLLYYATNIRLCQSGSQSLDRKNQMQEKKPRRGIQSVEIAFRILSVMQSSQQAMALKDIAPLADLTTSAANNYLVSLVRIGLAAADEKPGHYRLGPAALSLGVSAIQQIDGFEIVRREVTNLRDTTKRSAAVTTWTDDGPISLFKQDGDQRGAFEFRTGLIPMLTSAASTTRQRLSRNASPWRQDRGPRLASRLGPEFIRSRVARNSSPSK